DPEALKYVKDLKILNFIKESARNRYRDDKLSIKDASKKIREIVEEYLLSKGVDPKIPPTPLLEEQFIENIKAKPPKRKVDELRIAIIEYIEKHYEEDPELYERFSDRLKQILEAYKENWEILSIELEKLREEIKQGREAEQTFGFDPKKEMPFFGLLKQELFAKVPIEDLSNEQIEFLVNLTKDTIEIIARETKSVDFWENSTKQKTLRSHIISHLLKFIPSSPTSRQEKSSVKDGNTLYSSGINNKLFTKRNEIAQKLMELAYNIYGK
ncbi:MAG: restriction endonuclease subunit R, partial [Ignavibacteria bacterium]